MNEIIELFNDPIVHQLLYVTGIIGLLFIGFCMVVTVGDYLFQFYEYLQRRYYNRLKKEIRKDDY